MNDHIDDAIARARRLEADRGKFSRFFADRIREEIEARLVTLLETDLVKPLYKAEMVRRIIDTIVSEAWANLCLPDEDRYLARRLVVPLHDWLSALALSLGQPSLTPPPLPYETSMARERGL